MNRTKAPAAATSSAPDLMTPAPRMGRSPLEQSPGYYPPADPESASVWLGRRVARAVPDEFQGGAASLDDFGRELLDGLNAQDEKALHKLRVTRAEFEKILWPEFPQSRPITNITADDAWSLSEPRSLSGVSRAVSLFGGLRLRLDRVEYGSRQPFTNFDLYRDVVIVATNQTTGEGLRIAVAPSVAARHGRFKAMIFRD